MELSLSVYDIHSPRGMRTMSSVTGVVPGPRAPFGTRVKAGPSCVGYAGPWVKAQGVGRCSAARAQVVPCWPFALPPA